MKSLVVLALVPLTSAAAGVDPAQAQAAIAEARRLAAADAGALWGKPLGGPLLFADPVSRMAAASEADGEGHLAAKDGVFAGKLPDGVLVANTAIDWVGKRWTVVMWPLPAARYARGRLLMHELFHRLQPELGFVATNPANAHLDTLAGRTWLQLEWRALSEALIRKGEARRAATFDALLFRARRRQLVGAAAAEDERALEMNEGLAEYTGYRLSGLPADVLPDRVAARLDGAPTDGLSRGFAYLSGPAYGLLLDAAAPRWRKGLKASADLGALLAAAVSWKPPVDLEAEATAHAARYDGAALIADENEREAERLARLAIYKKDLVDGKVLRLPLSDKVSYSFDPNGIEIFDATSSVYTSTRMTDAWGILEVSQGAALVRREKGRPVEAVVAAPTPTADGAKGPGWTLKLAAGHKLEPGARAGDLDIRP